MAGPRSAEYYSIAPETVWGTDPASGYLGIPWESYSVANRNIVAPRDKFVGQVSNLNVDVAGQDLSGSSEAEVHPDNATLLLKDMCGLPRVTFNGNPNDLKSFTGKFYDPSVSKYYRQPGLKCNHARIMCDGPDGELKASFDWLGKTEEEIASFSLPTLPDQRAFQFKDSWQSGASLIKVANIAEPNIEKFEVSVPNNLRLSERRDDNGWRVWCDPGFRGDVTLSVTLRTSTDWAVDYHGLVRGQNTGTKFEFKFNYPGTGSPVDAVTILLPLVVIGEVSRTGGVRDVQTVTLTGTAKRQAAGDELQITIA